MLPHIIECLDALRADAHPTGVEKLNQDPNFWRIRAGRTHRVIYTILIESQTIIVALVSPHREIYREIANLNHQEIVRTALAEVQPRLVQGMRH